MNFPIRLARALLLTSFLAGALGLSISANAQAPSAGTKMQINLPGGSLQSSINALGEQAGIDVFASADLVRGKTVSALSGNMTIEDAFQRLLRGSGLIAVRQRNGSFLIQARTEEAPPSVPERQQETPTNVEEIVVLATKSGVPLSRTPQAVTVIDRAQIEQLNAQSVEEVLRYTPGVQSEFGGRRNTDFIIIRGFPQIEFAFRDGLRLSSLDFPTSQEVWGLESINILKGPASVLYGQIAPGGLINYQSKLPNGESILDTQLIAGAYGLFSAAVDVGGSLDEAGDWQFRLPVLYRQGDDPIDFIERRRLFAAPSLTWQLSDAMDLTFFTLFQDDEYDAPVSLPVSGTIEPNPNGPLPQFTFLGEPGLDKVEESQYRVGYIFNYRWESGLTFRQIARIHNTFELSGAIFASGFEPDGRTLNRGFSGSDLETDAFAIDNQLEGVFDSGSLQHRVLLGVDYFSETYAADFLSGSVAPIDAYEPVYGAPVTIDPDPFVYKEKSLQAHPYLQYRLTVADRFVAVGGMGYGWTRSEAFAFGEEFNDETVDAYVGNAALMYTTDNGLTVYGSYAQSFRPQLGIPPLEDGSRPDPSEGDQIEVGVKWAPPEGRMSATLAVYDLTLSDLLRFVQPPTGNGFNVVDGDSRHKGIDLDFSADVTDSLNLRGGYSYIDAQITGSVTGRDGLRPSNVPDHSASVFVTLDGAGAGLPGSSISLGARYFGERRGQGVSDRLPSAFLVDLAARYEFGRYQIGINVNNLLDERYIAGARGQGVNPGDPITASLVLNTSF